MVGMGLQIGDIEIPGWLPINKRHTMTGKVSCSFFGVRM